MEDNYLKSRSNAESGRDMKDLLSLFPRGYEKRFLVIYTILVPYVLGLLFFLFFIGEGIFYILSDIPYLVTWLVGYEVFSVLMLLYMLKNLFFGLKR